MIITVFREELVDGNELNEKKVEVLVQREQTIAEVSHSPHLEHLVH